MPEILGRTYTQTCKIHASGNQFQVSRKLARELGIVQGDVVCYFIHNSPQKYFYSARLSSGTEVYIKKSLVKSLGILPGSHIVVTVTPEILP